MIVDRTTQILKYITKEKSGIEVGPYFNPLVPKRLGYRSLALDVVDADALRKNALADPFVPKEAIGNIEEVDIVGSSSELEELVLSRYEPGSFDYVVSSHNFEHLPDPIRFLRGCEKVLRPGGFVSMAVPDRRVCFDYFRPLTTLAEWLDAFHEQRRRPSEATLFEASSLTSHFLRDGRLEPGFSLHDDPADLVPTETLEEAYAGWQARVQTGDAAYHDAHCSVMTPASLRLMLTDLAYLGLMRLEIVEISETNWHEFYVHLRNPAVPPARVGRDDFYARRRTLLNKMMEEQIEGAPQFRRFRAAGDLPFASRMDPRVAYSRRAAFRHWWTLMKAKRSRR